ncbi:DsbA family oxidoreductase [Streptomyces sp. NPDC054796]
MDPAHPAPHAPEPPVPSPSSPPSLPGVPAQREEAGDEAAGRGLRVEITEYTDPACPWAWGCEPTFRLLRERTRGLATWRRVFGILFDEDDDPPPDPAAEASWYAGFIARTARHTRAPFTSRLQWVASSSWPASLAAKAAEQQGPEVAERVLRRLRESTFVRGTPADTVDRVLEAVDGVKGLDTARLRAGLAEPATLDAVRDDWHEARDPLPEARSLRAPARHPHGAGVKELEVGVRYSLPTLVVRGPSGTVVVPGWRAPEEYVAALDAVASGSGSGSGYGSATRPVRPCGAHEALERYRSMTEPEWELLTDGSPPPAHAVRIETGNGALWLHPDEAIT